MGALNIMIMDENGRCIFDAVLEVVPETMPKIRLMDLKITLKMIQNNYIQRFIKFCGGKEAVSKKLQAFDTCAKIKARRATKRNNRCRGGSTPSLLAKQDGKKNLLDAKSLRRHS